PASPAIHERRYAQSKDRKKVSAWLQKFWQLLRVITRGLRAHKRFPSAAPQRNSSVADRLRRQPISTDLRGHQESKFPWHLIPASDCHNTNHIFFAAIDAG